MEKESKIFLAGHRGLLGSAVERRLRNEGFENLLVRTSAELDLTNQQATYDFLATEKPEHVFLCAAKVGGIKANMDAPADFLYRNLEIQNNVIEGSRRAGVKKLLFVGSSCIYPKEGRQPITEDQLLQGPLEPTNEGYALAKIAGIRMCQFYRRQYGCDFISAIPTNLFGIADNYDPNSAHLVPALIRKVHLAKKEGRRDIEIWGSGKPRREFMLSDDCASALVHLMKVYSTEMPVNVGTGEDATILELAEAVANALDWRVEFRMDPSKPDGMMRKQLDVSTLKSLGWAPEHSLKQGIAIAYKDFLERYP